MSQRTIQNLIVVVLVVLAAIYVVLPNSPGINMFGIQKQFTTQLGLDLRGGVQALLEADVPAGTSVSSEAMAGAVGVVENRVNGMGLTEALVQQAGDNRIVVELPGETDPEKALATLQQTGLLEFVDMSNIDANQAFALTDTYISTNLGPAPIITGTTTLTGTAAMPTFNTVLTGDKLEAVSVQTGQTGGYEIAFKLNSEGARIFADFTATHINQILAIVVDKRVISTPNISSSIPNGEGIISGDFDLARANDLAVQLRYGSLPVPLKLVDSRTVGPTLGQDSLNRSLQAGVVGFIIIMLFMALFYRLPGLLADVAIVIFATIIFAIFRFIPVTLTLPGIAGLMLSIGSALDANILIFERIKEELRAGKTLRTAVDLGFRRAWSSIRDSNVATLLTCAILFWFGSTYGATIVKGFSITLALGVAVSLFTALVVTRLLMDLLVQYFKSKDYEKWFGI